MFRKLNRLVGKMTNLVINVSLIVTIVVLPILMYHLVKSIVFQRFVLSTIIGLVILMTIRINKNLQGGN